MCRKGQRVCWGPPAGTREAKVRRQEGPPQRVKGGQFSLVLEAGGQLVGRCFGDDKSSLCVVGSCVFWKDREGAVIL